MRGSEARRSLPPQPSQGTFGSLYYALGLNIECTNDTFVLAEPSAPMPSAAPVKEVRLRAAYSQSSPQSNGVTYYVDYTDGSDSNSGS